jgi:CRP-like cAMP-binding protein
MNQEFIDFIEHIVKVSPELKKAINSLETKSIEVKAGETFISEGSRTPFMYFIKKGLVRSYFLDKDKDRTYWFYREDDMFTSWYSFYLGDPSFESFMALEDTTMFAVSKTQYETLVKEHKEFAEFSRKFIEYKYAYMDYMTKTFIDLTAKEKYDYLLKTEPSLINRVKLGYIASYLGVSQETLSRIRARKV